MPYFILTANDQAQFLPPFTPAIVTAPNGILKGKGKCKINGNLVCVDGDEKTATVPSATYMNPMYPVGPGKGTVSIESLAPNQTAQKVKSGGKAVLLIGAMFNANHEVIQGAKKLPPPTDSGLPEPPKTNHSGQGQFITTNVKVRGI